MKQLHITAKQVYGNTLLYPACREAEIFCEIARKRTLDITDLTNIKKLGFEVKIQPYLEPDIAIALC